MTGRDGFFQFSLPVHWGVWRPWKSDGSSALRLYATYTATKQRVKRFLSSSNEDSRDSKIPGKPRCFQVVKTKTLLYIIWNVQVVDTAMGPNSHVLHLAESSVNSDACQTLSSPGVQAASCCTAKETRQDRQESTFGLAPSPPKVSREENEIYLCSKPTRHKKC